MFLTLWVKSALQLGVGFFCCCYVNMYSTVIQGHHLSIWTLGVRGRCKQLSMAKNIVKPVLIATAVTAVCAVLSIVL